MDDHEPIGDPVLGLLSWDRDLKSWQFQVTLPTGKLVPVSFTPEDWQVPLDDRDLPELRRVIGWIQDNEPSIRAYICDQMFQNWYDDEIDKIMTQDEFKEAIALAGILVLEDRSATLNYNDANLFGGHAIVLSVDREGHFLDEPNLWG